MRNFLTGIFMVFVLGVPTVNASGWSPPNDAELKMLPNFCTDILRGQGNPDARARLKPVIGQLKSVQHYCYGLNFLNRYYRSPHSAGAKSNLAMAHQEIGRVAEIAKTMDPGSAPLAAEVFLNRGIVNSLMKKDSAALRDLLQAASLNPRLAKVHLTLADFYNDRKQRAKALEVVTEGLRHVPDSRGLKRQYQELGGKFPYPEPVVAIPEPVSKTEKPAEDVSANNPSKQPVIEPTTKTNLPVEKVSSKEGTEEGTVIGTPKNPWCRFCPPGE